MLIWVLSLGLALVHVFACGSMVFFYFMDCFASFAGKTIHKKSIIPPEPKPQSFEF